jgi:hypothetical protein
MPETLIQRGERRHEQCRYGRLTEAFHIDHATGRETPTCLPLCTFKPAGPIPPALEREWGGLVDFDRDCAVCDAYEALQ